MLDKINNQVIIIDSRKVMIWHLAVGIVVTRPTSRANLPEPIIAIPAWPILDAVEDVAFMILWRLAVAGNELTKP